MELRFTNPVNLIIGEGAVVKNAAKFAELGKTCLIVTDKVSGRVSGALADVETALKEAGVSYKIFDEITANPDLLDVERAANLAKEIGAEYIVGIGGGSAIDAAKVAALIATNEINPITDIFKRLWTNKPLPKIVIGTTAGTGSEVTPFAIVTDPTTTIKMSVWTPDHFPVYSFGDPRYTATLPIGQTIATGMDALSHCLDAYFLNQADMMSDMMAIEGIKLVLKNFEGILNKKIEDITPEQRFELYVASIYGGYAITRASTAWTHSFSYHLTERYDIPHGIAVAQFLPSYLNEGEEFAKAKSDALYAAIGIGKAELIKFIEDHSKIDIPKVSDEDIKVWVDKQMPKGTLKSSPRGGMDEAMVERMVREAIRQF